MSRRADIEKEFYLSMLVDREPRASPSSSPPKGGMDIEEVAADAREDHHLGRRSGDRHPAHHGRAFASGAEPAGASPSRPEPVGSKLYKGLRRTDMEPARDQPADRHPDGKASCASTPRCRSTTTRSVPPSRRSSSCATSTKEDEKEIEASKYDLNYITPRRRHRLHGQRRRPRHGDDGHHQALRREPANFLDVGGGASQGEGDGGLQDHHRRPEREGHPDQHLRRHHAKCDIIAEGVIAAGEGSRPPGAAGRAPRRHQCRTGQEDGATPASTSSPPTTSTTPRPEDRRRREEAA